MFEWRYASAALPALLKGAVITLGASLLAVFLGAVVGVVLTLMRELRIRAVDYLVSAYISIMRGTPLFIQILFVFYALPAVGFDVPGFQSGVIALSLNSGAYVAETIRGCLSAIPLGQIEAARAFGMRNALTWRRVVLPQVFFLSLPPLAVEFTSLLKASALLSVIAVVELTRTAQQIIGATSRPTEVWLVTGALYFVMCYALGSVARRFERLASIRRP